MDRTPSSLVTTRAEMLELPDVEAMVRLVSETCDPALAVSVADRRERLYRGIAELVGADTWMGGVCYSSPKNLADSVPLHVYDGGWRDEAERMRAWGVAQNLDLAAEINRFSIQAVVEMRTLTYLRSAAMDDASFYSSPGGRAWIAAGFDQFLMSVFPLENTMHSAIGLHRRVGRPAFTDRDRTVVHVLWQQVEWLHRQDNALPVGSQVVELSLRERQVLMLLMGGASRKRAAESLGLSEHTVGDYVKGIYRKLAVTSRGELLAKFIPSRS